MSIPFQRMKIRTFTVYRSYMKGALIIPFGFLVFQFLRFIAYQSENALGKPFNIEPLMVCMIGASFASHRSDRREKFANILEKSCKYSNPSFNNYFTSSICFSSLFYSYWGIFGSYSCFGKSSFGMYDMLASYPFDFRWKHDSRKVLLGS